MPENVPDEEVGTRATGDNTTPYFYYYRGEKQYLELDTRRVFVAMFDEAKIKEFASSVAKSHSANAGAHKQSIDKSFYTKLSFDGKMSDEEYLAKLADIKASGRDIIVAPYFKNRYQDDIGLSNFFYVKLKQAGDAALLEQEAAKVNAVIDHQVDFMPLWYVLSVTENSEFNAMELSNRFYESGLFQCAEPDLMVQDRLSSSDDFYNDQWGLKNTGQSGGTAGVDIDIERAWQISTGHNVVVAVIDQGIYLGHDDLEANIYPQSFDSENGTLTNPVPQKIEGDHGTKVAGIIGAKRNNTIGIAGVAPDCKIMSVSNRLDQSTLSRENRAKGINWAWQNGADVINNSWQSSLRVQAIDDAIHDAVTYGRNGNGCVVVFASGNDVTYPLTGEPVSYPATLENVMAVGAVNRYGNRHYDSNYGPELDVVAPGADIWTTTLSGGYDTFPGTSAAAPHVAGIAALILSEYPHLTWQQVHGYIKVSASGGSIEKGNGLVNAYLAVAPTTPPAFTPNKLLVNSGESVTFTVNDVRGDVSYQWKIYDQIVTGNNTGTLTFNAYTPPILLGIGPGDPDPDRSALMAVSCQATGPKGTSTWYMDAITVKYP